MSITPSPTITVTPTITPTIGSCGVLDYCISLGNPDYDGTYTRNGVYNGYSYYTNSSTNSVIYYNGTTWCLSDTLGGSCILLGPVPATLPCPSFSNTVFSVGNCQTPTPTPTPSVTPSVTTSVTPTASLTPTIAQTVTPTVTITPTPTGVACVGVSAYSIITIVPDVTPTPSVTSTIPVTKITFIGEASFTVVNNTFVCN